MLDLADFRETYLKFCKYQKKLDDKTLKAYNIDLKQFITFSQQSGAELSRASLTSFITELHQKYKPKSAKRKIASVKAYTYPLPNELWHSIESFITFYNEKRPHSSIGNIPPAQAENIYWSQM